VWATKEEVGQLRRVQHSFFADLLLQQFLRLRADEVCALAVEVFPFDESKLDPVFFPAAELDLECVLLSLALH
jgi:hypothetical protein